MAKSMTSTFYVRVDQDIDNDNGFYQGEIDLGAYVNVLGKSVLSIKSVQVALTDAGGRMPDITASVSAAYSWQLTTQSQTNIVRISDNSVIAAGGGTAAEAGAGTISTGYSEFSVGPHHFQTDDGYMVATESMYLGGSATTGWTENIFVSLILECQVVTMDVQDGVALALSQQ